MATLTLLQYTRTKSQVCGRGKRVPHTPFSVLAVCSYPVYPSSLRGRVNIIDAISQPLSTESTDDAPLRTDCQNHEAKCLGKKGVVIFVYILL